MIANSNLANTLNTGVMPTNYEVMKYFKILRLYALNRIKWSSDHIPDSELRLIEWNLFHYGKCAMLRPEVRVDDIIFTSQQPKIFRCNFSEWNKRNGRPRKITIANEQDIPASVTMEYSEDKFTIFSDEFMFQDQGVPFSSIAWEYACKLHEIDLAISMNLRKLRMPFVFNSAGQTQDNTGNPAAIINRGVTVAELMRSAYLRNEPFTEIPDNMVGQTFMHEPAHTENYVNDLLQTQKQVYQGYMELLGLFTDKQKTGAYKIKRLQEDGDDSPDFITEVEKSSRLLSAKDAALKFKINLVMEVI